MGQSGDSKLEAIANQGLSQSGLPRRHDGQSVYIPGKKVPHGGWQVVCGEETRYWGREGRDALGIRLPCQAANWTGHGPPGGNEISRRTRIWSSRLCIKGEWAARRTASNLVAGRDRRCRLQLSIARPGIMDASIARLACREKNWTLQLGNRDGTSFDWLKLLRLLESNSRPGSGGHASVTSVSAGLEAHALLWQAW